MKLPSAFRRPAELEADPSLEEEMSPAEHTSEQDTEIAGVGQNEDRLSRVALLVAALGALFIAFVQAPGNIIDDTKLPLNMSPLAFMANSLHLWNPTQSSGSVQTETYGYLFPMGPFFGLGEALHVPVWITERLWLALLLTVSFWGMIRLAEALGIGGRGGRIAGAVAYTVAPIVVTWAGSSAALLAVALLPWVVVPLVRGAAGGSPRRAAAASGFAVALMGGVNATVVLAMLPVPVIWLLTRQRGPRQRALIGWWFVALVLACFWWGIALLLQGHYGYNYLSYTETSAVTTQTTSVFEAVRGASFWTDYLTLGSPLLPGDWSIISTWSISLGASVVAALGITGLALRGIRERVFLVTTLAFGVLVIAAGYDGSLSGPAAHGIQHVLEQPFALLRNVSKFSPVVALPLALGLAWLLSYIPWNQAVDRARQVRKLPRSWLHWGLVVVATGALVAASAPFWQAKLYPPGGFSAIPSYWGSAARWLDTHQSHGTALLVPGAEFARYTWGRSLDEPLAVDLSSDWTVRSIVPFGSNGNDLVLDTIESSLNSGVVAPGMAAYLARAGFDYVVERNDLNLQTTGAPPPAQVDQVLSESPGLQRVAGFGPIISRAQASASRLDVYDSLNPGRGLRSVEIFRVTQAVPVVRTYPASDPVVVSGSPSSLLPLVASGALDNRVAVLAGDPHGGAVAAKASSATWADTDGNQRRDEAFGLIQDNYSYVLGPHQRTASASPDVPQDLDPVSGEQHQTVAEPLGAASVSASSYGSTTLSLDPAEGPASAFSQNPTIAWVGTDVADSVGQWVQIDFDHAMTLSTIRLRPLTDTSARPRVVEVTITTARGSVHRSVKAGVNQLHIAAGSTKWLRITLTKVHPARTSLFDEIPLGAGLTGVTIPGINFSPALRLPSDEASSFSGSGSKSLLFSFNAPLVNANLDLDAPQDDDPQMIRRFAVPKKTTMSLTGDATPVPGLPLDLVLPPLASYLKVAATSSLANLPRFSANNLIDGSGRPWIAGLGNKTPSIDVNWIGLRSVDSIYLKPSGEASLPQLIQINGLSKTDKFIKSVPAGGGTISFPAIRTNTLSITFLKVKGRFAKVPTFGADFIAPVGLQELTIPALGPVKANLSSSTPYSLKCGKGPTVSLDGSVFQTRLSGTIGDVEALRPLTLTLCSGPVTLTRGKHLLTAGSDYGAFKITSLMASPVVKQPTMPTRATRIVGAWTAQHRTVHVGAGATSYIAVAQNFNLGWKATFDGHQLTAVRIDGWQQAWIIPSGAAGTLTMVYAPDTEYHAGLAIGAVFLVGLVLLALVRSRRRRDVPPSGPLKHLSALIAGALGFAVLVLVAGPLALVLLPLVLIAIRWGPNATAFIAGGAFLAAGLDAALSPGAQPVTRLGAFSPAAQVLSTLALAAVFASLVATCRSQRPHREQPNESLPTVDASCELNAPNEHPQPEHAGTPPAPEEVGADTTAVLTS